MSLSGWLHEKLAYRRRTEILASRVSVLLSHGATVLDVGCGDGTIDRIIMRLRPDVTITGIDVLIRDSVAIPVRYFDGRHIPYASDSFDTVLFVDVLHHTLHIEGLLEEAARVSRRSIILKDHLKKGVMAASTLRFMDWYGNARHGVSLPYNYLSEQQWHGVFEKLGLSIVSWETALGLYPWPANLLFDRSLHLITELSKAPPRSNVKDC